MCSKYVPVMTSTVDANGFFFFARGKLACVYDVC